MTKQRKTRRTIGIDEKIQLAKDAVARAKARYDKTVSLLKRLLDKRDEKRKEELMKAIDSSDRTYEEILRFIRS